VTVRYTTDLGLGLCILKIDLFFLPQNVVEECMHAEFVVDQIIGTVPKHCLWALKPRNTNGLINFKLYHAMRLVRLLTQV